MRCSCFSSSAGSRTAHCCNSTESCAWSRGLEANKTCCPLSTTPACCSMVCTRRSFFCTARIFFSMSRGSCVASSEDAPSSAAAAASSAASAAARPLGPDHESEHDCVSGSSSTLRMRGGEEGSSSLSSMCVATCRMAARGRTLASVEWLCTAVCSAPLGSEGGSRYGASSVSWCEENSIGCSSDSAGGCGGRPSPPSAACGRELPLRW
mmetsp:Transcript_7788/g.15883  ORF Transcript_7788/g.15883 Transcript_7788/m.15883 type:complete len:209 (-) Transcript_7788:355-981(-)